MIKLKSKYSEQQLIERWDKRMSPERFAGNDDYMDLCYCGFRKGKKIKLTRRTGISREPFSAVFRGKIVARSGGSEIHGYFTKGISDYITVAFVLAFVLTIYMVVKFRNAPLTAINVLVAVTIVLAFILLFTWSGTKKKYIAFLKEIL